MRTEYQCDDCIHAEVCGKKNTYQRIVDKIDTLTFITEDNTEKYVRLFSGVHIEVSCDYYSPVLNTTTK